MVTAGFCTRSGLTIVRAAELLPLPLLFIILTKWFYWIDVRPLVTVGGIYVYDNIPIHIMSYTHIVSISHFRIRFVELVLYCNIGDRRLNYYSANQIKMTGCVKGKKAHIISYIRYLYATRIIYVWYIGIRL